MAAVTVVEKIYGGRVPVRYCRSSGAGAADTEATLTTTRGVPCLLKRVHVHYSGAVTQAGVTVGVDSGLGTNYDHLLHTGAADVVDTVYNPEGDGDLLSPGDEVVVVAPAGGATDVAYIQVLTEDL